MTRPGCLVTGATGALGPAVVSALGRSHAIRTFSRHPPAAGLFDVPVDPRTGDIADVEAIRRAARGVERIVHLAALLHVVDPLPAMRAEYERVNVQGTASVVEAALTERVARIVLVSSIAVYGDTGGRVVDEESPPRPDTFYAETKLAAERIALSARRADGGPLSTVLRAAAVYGPRVKGNYRRLVDAIARGRFVPIGRGASRRTLVFDEDLSSAIAVAATHDAAPGRIYNVSDGQFHQLSQIIAAISEALHRPAPVWHLPVAPVRIAATVGGWFDRRLPRMLEKYLEDVAVDARRIQNELGFRPAFDLRHGWALTIERMRRQPI